MYIIVSYDIIQDLRRAKVANILKDYGTRVQYSVFECSVDDKTLERMRRRLLKLLKEEEDKLRIYKVCETCRSRIESYGKGEIPPEPEVYIV